MYCHKLVYFAWRIKKVPFFPRNSYKLFVMRQMQISVAIKHLMLLKWIREHKKYVELEEMVPISALVISLTGFRTHLKYAASMLLSVSEWGIERGKIIVGVIIGRSVFPVRWAN